jgi:hypothetical protein
VRRNNRQWYRTTDAESSPVKLSDDGERVFMITGFGVHDGTD